MFVVNAHCVFCELGTRFPRYHDELHDPYSQMPKVDLREMDSEDDSWIELALDCAVWWRVVLAVVQAKFRVGGAL